MDRSTREHYILELLSSDGSLSVATLSQDLGVSEVTIRNHLRSLEQQGLLARTWGGAKSVSIQNVLDRVKVQEKEKERVAQKAAELVNDYDHIMIEAGTTTALIAKYLSGKRGIQIVTNSLLVLTYARANPDLEVILTGGQFHRESESMVGPVAVASISRFNARLAFVGTDGFTAERGVTTQFAEGAEIIAAMTTRAEEIWLVADHSKYGRAGFVNALETEQLSGVIVDSGLAPEPTASLSESPVGTLFA